jgi:ribosomal protein S18 acetylase RimI-like enzyme
VRIERVTEARDDVLAALARLLPQLSPRATPTREELVDLLEQPRVRLLVARDDSAGIVGALTLVLYRMPSGLTGRIEDVVVDEAARGRGAGEALVREALRLAQAEGARSIGLTSRPEREAANRLYRRVGFEQRATNVYVWRAL